MNVMIKSLFFVLFCLAASPLILHAGYTVKDGKLVDADIVATMPVEGHYTAGVKAMESKDWYEAERQFSIASANFPGSPYGQEAFFYLGVAQFNLEEFDMANESFSKYLQAKGHPRLFQAAIEYKFAIAEKFREGARRRLLGTKQLPKWATGGTIALKTYDEVIAAVPCHDLAAKALYSKGMLHWTRKEYRDSVDCFHTIVKRFPKHELAPESYLCITKVYLDQCRFEFQNPDILAFAQIHLRKFKQDFPKEDRISIVERDVLAIKEVYAKGLFETGQFYERKGKPDASAIYYQNAIRQFPETFSSKKSTARLTALGFEVPAPKPIFIPQKDNEGEGPLKIESIDWMP